MFLTPHIPLLRRMASVVKVLAVPSTASRIAAVFSLAFPLGIGRVIGSHWRNGILRSLLHVGQVGIRNGSNNRRQW